MTLTRVLLGEAATEDGYMAVYVDDHYKFASSQFRGMRMSHMIADTDDELLAMVKRLGLQLRWKHGDHFDVAISKRALAVQAGAVEISWRTCALMCMIRRMTGVLGNPDTAAEEWRRLWDERRAAREDAERGHSDGLSIADLSGGLRLQIFCRK